MKSSATEGKKASHPSNGGPAIYLRLLCPGVDEVELLVPSQSASAEHFDTPGVCPKPVMPPQTHAGKALVLEELELELLEVLLEVLDLGRTQTP